MEDPNGDKSSKVSLDSDLYGGDATLNHMACLIDISLDFRNMEGIEISITLLEKLLEKELTPVKEGILYYFMANAWSTLKYLRRTETSPLWDSEQEEMEKEIIYLRRALKERCFEELPKFRKCQILTNLGSLMTEIGRFVEALEYLNKAISIDPSFAMAYGKKGYGIAWYSSALYDKGHEFVFLKYAHSNLEKALCAELHPSARKKFAEHKKTDRIYTLSSSS